MSAVEVGSRSIAVRLKNPRGQIVTALNIGLPMSDESMTTIIERYLTALLSLSKELSGIVMA